jgi:large conductance mechanosensitive channel
MLQEFKDFINRGNVVDLAVAVIIGAAFTQVITAFTNDILGGVLALLGGQPNFDSLDLTIGDTTIVYGRFLTAVVNFLLVAWVMFLVVKALNKMQDLGRRKEEGVEAVALTEVELLTEIRDLLRVRD